MKIWGGAMLVAVALLVATAGASADPWANEATMMAAPNHETFVYDPGHVYIDRDALLAEPLASYYNARGFDENFRTWAPVRFLDVASAADWSGCVDAVHPQPCPVGDLHYAPVLHALSSGTIKTVEWNGAYIALACGNFTEGGAAGPTPTPTISGVKYEDLDANGQRDSGEPGLSGWTMRLLYNGTQVASTTTGAGGGYSFDLDADDLPIGAGSYQVVEVQQSGWHASQAPGAVSVPLGAGDHAYTGNDFGNYRNATISGSKFDDSNVDGVWDTVLESGLASWTIDLSGDGSDSAATAAGGAYSFSVRPGTYTVQEEAQAHWRQTNPGGDGTHAYTVVSGQVVSGADFGNVCLGSSVVRPVDDTTGAAVNGLEVRIEEVSVPGVLANDPSLPLTTTGTPTFADLLPGTYKITAFLPAGLYTNDSDVALVDGRFAVVKTIAVQECRATEVPLHFVSGSTPGKVTGGALEIALDGGRETSGFEFMTRRGVPVGTLQFVDHAGGPTLHTSAIDDLQLLSAQEAIVWGHVPVGGAAVQFRLRLVDAGEPGTADHYELWLANGYRAGFDGPLTGGNVQIHG